MNERLKIFVNFLIVNLAIKNQADFAANIGIAKSQFSEVLSGKRKITDNLVNKIHNSYPSLNRNWLSTGEGEMLTSVIQNNKNGDNIQGNTITINKQDGEMSDVIKSLVSQLFTSQQQISKNQEQIDRLITLIENKL